MSRPCWLRSVVLSPFSYRYLPARLQLTPSLSNEFLRRRQTGTSAGPPERGAPKNTSEAPAVWLDLSVVRLADTYHQSLQQWYTSHNVFGMKKGSKDVLMNVNHSLLQHVDILPFANRLEDIRPHRGAHLADVRCPQQIHERT